MNPAETKRYCALAHRLAQANGTAHLLEGLWATVLVFAERLGCTTFGSSGRQPRGVQFRRKGQILFIFWVERYRSNLRGVGAISFSLKQFDPEFSRSLGELLTRLSVKPGVPVPTDGNRPFEVVGFSTVEAGTAILQELDKAVRRGLALRGDALFVGGVFSPEPSTRSSGADPDDPPLDVDPIVWRQIVERRGQPGFRRDLLKAYQQRCAITGCTAVAALEAAHIIPYSEDPRYEVAAGILLRADIHTLFDLHLLSFEPESLRVCLASSIADAYADLKGLSLQLPGETTLRPSRERLQRHFAEFEKVVVAGE